MKRIIPFVFALLLLSLPIMALAQNYSYKYEGDITPDQSAQQERVRALVISFFSIYIVTGIMICVWVYKDAEARAIEDAATAMWIILVIFTWIIGLLVYIAVRPSGNLVSCQECGKKRLSAIAKCPHCGR